MFAKEICHPRENYNCHTNPEFDLQLRCILAYLSGVLTLLDGSLETFLKHIDVLDIQQIKVVAPSVFQYKAF